jgi:hypothetical protein
MATKAISEVILPEDLKSKQRVRVPVAAKLNGMSEATFRRHHSHLILKVSPRCEVVDLAAALALGRETPPAA